MVLVLPLLWSIELGAEPQELALGPGEPMVVGGDHEDAVPAPALALLALDVDRSRLEAAEWAMRRPA